MGLENLKSAFSNIKPFELCDLSTFDSRYDDPAAATGDVQKTTP